MDDKRDVVKADHSLPLTRPFIQPPSINAIWKGENESDSEYVEEQDFPLDGCGVWTEQEAFRLYHDKLVKLRDLYMGQLSRLKHLMQERRRRFLVEWQACGGNKADASLPSRGGGKQHAAYRTYRKRSGEEGLLERRLKLRRLAATLDIYSKKEVRDANRPHYQHLVKLQQSLKSANISPCLNGNCHNNSLPYSSRCSKHVLEDTKQQMYTQCSFSYETEAGSVVSCHNPVLRYLNPRLCGGHWDQSQVCLSETEDEEENDCQPVGDVVDKKGPILIKK